MAQFAYPTKDQFKTAAVSLAHALLTRDFANKSALLLNAYVVLGYALSHVDSSPFAIRDEMTDDTLALGEEYGDEELIEILDAAAAQSDDNPQVVGSIPIPWKLLIRLIVNAILNHAL